MFHPGHEIRLEEARHPILDKMMKETRYVSNDLHMKPDCSVLMITGPNMGGKSTYMRQTALIVLLAQIGCYVPARRAELPIFDQIFTRIGASDDITVSYTHLHRGAWLFHIQSHNHDAFHSGCCQSTVQQIRYQ